MDLNIKNTIVAYCNKKVISSLVLQKYCDCFSTFAQGFLNFSAKMHYVWQGVLIAILWQIRDVKIVANSLYVCQGTYIAKFRK